MIRNDYATLNMCGKAIFGKWVKDYGKIGADENYGLIRLVFPSNQSTYSTEPKRNLNAKGNFLPQSCSTRQKKGSDSGLHFGNKSSFAAKGAYGAIKDALVKKDKMKSG